MLEQTGATPAGRAMAEPVAAFLDYLNAVSEILTTRPPRAGRRARRMQAALGHAVVFPTWQSLTRNQGLTNDEAVAVMAAMVEAAGEARPRR